MKFILKWKSLLVIAFVFLMAAATEAIIKDSQNGKIMVWEGTCNINYWTGDDRVVWPVLACGEKRLELRDGKLAISTLNAGSKSFHCRVYANDSLECKTPGK